MKILMARPRLEAGGATKAILLLSEGLTRAGHDITIVTQSGDCLESVRQLNLNLCYLPLYPTSPSNFVQSTVGLLKMVRRERFDLIHSHHRFSNLVCKFVSQLTTIPTIATVHEFKDNRPWPTRLGLPQHIIVYSQALKSHLITSYGIQGHRISVIKMGIRPGLLTSQTNAVSKTGLKQPMNGPLIGCVSRISAEKGLNVLLKAISQVKKEGYQADYLIIGDGPLRQELENLSSQLDLNDQVHFLGWQGNVTTIIANVEFLILPSLSEGLGLVVLEGLIHAKPTIGSRVGGIPEIIQDGVNGLLVPPGDVDALTKAIIHLLRNPDFTMQLGWAGQQTLNRDFSVETMVKQTEKIYQAALLNTNPKL